MAKFVIKGTGNFNHVLNELDKSIKNSISASLEDSSSGRLGDTRFETRVYERYSWLGGNRLSLTLTLIGSGDQLNLSLITAGGSQAMFFKINRFGENSFLNSVVPTAKTLIK